MDTFSTEMYGQCAWCGLVDSGPYKGMIMFEEIAGHVVVPLLVEGYSHGVCSVCDALVRGDYRFRRQEKKKPAMHGNIIQFYTKE